jgi:hypothetical protein
LSLVKEAYRTGHCGDYQHRGLICRLFGYATVRDKTGQRVLSTCKWIKASQPEALEQTKGLIEAQQVPHYLHYYQRLAQIDFRLGQEYLPISQAMLRALEEVEHYYQYRPFPYRHRRAA